jgi:hypothetical protein
MNLSLVDSFSMILRKRNEGEDSFAKDPRGDCKSDRIIEIDPVAENLVCLCSDLLAVRAESDMMKGC